MSRDAPKYHNDAAMIQSIAGGPIYAGCSACDRRSVKAESRLGVRAEEGMNVRVGGART